MTATQHDEARSRWDRDEPLASPPSRMWLVPANLGDSEPNWDTTLGSSRPEGFNLETEYVRAIPAPVVTVDDAMVDRAADMLCRLDQGYDLEVYRSLSRAALEAALGVKP